MNGKDENQDFNDEDEEHLALIVEDDLSTQFFLESVLKEKKYDCKKAVNVLDAIKHIMDAMDNQQSFEVIFLDIKLKDSQNGVELLKTIRENDWMSQALIIVMSGVEETSYVRECHSYNISNYIKKPINKTNLLNEIIKAQKHVKQFKCPIPAYKIEKKIGAGASGVVYLVRHKESKELFAMKSVEIDPNKNNGQFNEVKYYQGLKSPTILELFDYKITENNLYMILQYAECGTLSDLILKKKTTGGSIDVNTILRYICQLLLGLHVIHEKKLLHRDIKSDNLFMCNMNLLKIGDLGVAKAIDKGAHTICGTYNYMAPEIFEYKEYNSAVDIWAAGIVLYEMVMLELPFDGSTEQIMKRAKKLDCKPFPDYVDERLQNLWDLMVKVGPDERFNATELLRLDFMKEVLEKLCDDKIITIDDDIKFTVFHNMDQNDNTDIDKKGLLKIFENEKKLLKQYFKDFKTIMLLDLNTEKCSYKPGYFSCVMNNLVKGSELDQAMSDAKIPPEVVNKLIADKYIINIQKPNEDELDCSETAYYQIKLFHDQDIDNSLICNLDTDNIHKNALKSSWECLFKIETMWNQLQKNSEDDKFKQDLLTSSQYFEFLIEIKHFKNIDMSLYNKTQKLAIMLNIYQVMFLHTLVKAEIYPSSGKTNGGLVQTMKGIFVNTNINNGVIYEIAGHKLSLYEMKHIVMRRNKKPLGAYCRLVYNSDLRIALIEEAENPKLSIICLDPPIDRIESEINYVFTRFNDKNLKEEIDNHCKKFITENIEKEDDTILKIPSYFKSYMADFGSNEIEMVKSLLKHHTDPELKVNTIVKQINKNELSISYY